MYSCQICSKKLKYSLINMGKVPIVNHLLLEKELNENSYDLEVFSFVQNVNYIN